VVACRYAGLIVASCGVLAEVWTCPVGAARSYRERYGAALRLRYLVGARYGGVPVSAPIVSLSLSLSHLSRSDPEHMRRFAPS
jgi:hypothetical protein